MNGSSRVFAGVAGILIVFAAGCETGGKTGALAGAGIGALAGQAIGRDTESTLIGAAIGTGIGYIIGNEKDKKHAQEMRQADKKDDYAHTEVGPLGGTRWLLQDVSPKSRVPKYASKTVEFQPYGRVVTTTTNPDGSVQVTDERYRVVGNALIINKPGFLVNARYGISGDELVVTAEDFTAVLRRIR